MRIAIYGAGGVGGYYGGRLAQSGHDVTFIARGDHLRAIQQRGLSVTSPRGDFTIRPAQATADPLAVGPVELVIVGIKTWQVPAAAVAMRPLVGPLTMVLPLQNGVEAADQIVAELGPEPVLGGVTRIFSAVVGPGEIHDRGGPANIVFGELDGPVRPRTERLLAVLTGAGIAAEITTDVRRTLWEKFLFVVSLGAVGAVSRAPVGALRSLPETREMLETCMGEIAAVAQARGITLAEGLIGANMAFLDGLPAEADSSLQRDVIAGRPSELDAWSGAVVRFGRAAGVPTPTHEVIYRALRPQELRARGAVHFAL
jgi:2-dehydropantoate 2-reductase